MFCRLPISLSVRIWPFQGRGRGSIPRWGISFFATLSFSSTFLLPILSLPFPLFSFLFSLFPLCRCPEPFSFSPFIFFICPSCPFLLFSPFPFAFILFHSTSPSIFIFEAVSLPSVVIINGLSRVLSSLHFTQYSHPSLAVGTGRVFHSQQPTLHMYRFHSQLILFCVSRINT